MTFFMLILEWRILKHRYFRSYWFWGLILIQILFLARYKKHQLFFYSLSEEIKIYYFRPIWDIILYLSTWGVFENKPFLAKIQRVTPLKTQFWDNYFGPCWTLEAFFRRFLENVHLGAETKKKCGFFIFLSKLKKSHNLVFSP